MASLVGLGLTLLVALQPPGSTPPTSPTAPTPDLQDPSDTSESREAAGPEEPPPAGASLRVLVAGSEPFVIPREDGSFDGIAAEVWKAMAQRLDTPYEMVAVASVSEGISRVEAGRGDVLVGPVSITAERAEAVSFTQPWYQASLGILAPPGSSALLAKVRPFLSTAFAIGVAFLLLVLLIVGTAFWFTERKHNPDHFPQHPVRGIGNGVWLALVTMTTVGYGDRVPLSLGGRIVAGIWMVVAMITASSLTASIATALTLSQLDTGTISRADELAGETVAVLEGTPGVEFARRHGGHVLPVEDFEAAIDALRSNEARAFVHDRPILRYWRSEHPESELVLSPAKYDARGYGFALPHRSPHLNRLDVALLELDEADELEDIFERWLGLDE